MHAREELARAYAADGRLDAALAIFYRCITDVATLLGEDHPTTLRFRVRRATIVREYGAPQGAIAELEQLTTLYKQVLGSNNYETAHALESLALTYRAVGRLPDAITAYEEAARICTHTAGPDSPLTRRLAAELTAVQQQANTRPWSRRLRLRL